MPDQTPLAPYAPRTAYESLQIAVGPGIKETAYSAARRHSRARDRDVPTIRPDEMAEDAGVQEFLKAYATLLVSQGTQADAAIEDANILGVHLHYLANYELHNRKTFWVDPPLAWMLAQTELDIDGELLRLPFPSCAFIFNDPTACALGDGLIALDNAVTRKSPIKAVTVYWLEIPGEGDARGLRACVLLDSLERGRWPYLLARDLKVAPAGRLDAILESHFAEVDPGNRDPVFTSPGLKGLLRLAINAVLYATSADAEVVRRQPPRVNPDGMQQGRISHRQLKRMRRLEHASSLLSSEEVYFLPGKIDIKRVEQLRAVEHHREGRRLMTRFLVRGHWHRAHASWVDQRPRWIQPYWKGPEMAAVIEREYRLRE